MSGVLVAGAHHVEHAQVVPDGRPLGGREDGADAAATAAAGRRVTPVRAIRQ